MKTYEVKKTTDRRFRHHQRTGRIWSSNQPAWFVYIDGQWTGQEYATKKDAQKHVEFFRCRDDRQG